VKFMVWEKKCLIFVFILLISVSAVAAMRGSPAIVTITYDPAVGVDDDFQLNFISTESPPGIADISVLGEGTYERFSPLPDGTSAFNTSQIDEYVTFDKKVLDLSKEHAVNVHIKIPPNEPLAGPHEFGIISSERPKNPSGMLVITTAVIIKIRVDIPFPGQYLDITRFGIENVNQGQNAGFNWQVKGRGLELTPFNAKLEVFSKDGSTLYTRELGNFVVAPGDVYPITANDDPLPTSSFVPGPYKGVLTVRFDGKVKTSTSIFNVGEEAVSLDNYTPSRLVYGEINQVHLTIRNLWNGQFDNVHAEISLNGTTTTTPSTVMRPFETIELGQFIDSSNVPEGNYTGTVKVYFGTKSNTFPVNFEVAKKVLPPPPEPEKKAFNYVPYLIGGVVLLLILLAILLLKSRKKPGVEESKSTSKTVSVPAADVSSNKEASVKVKKAEKAGKSGKTK
jgi:hypothetical protein